MKNGTVISIDIVNFKKICANKKSGDITDYLTQFYSFIGDLIKENQWRIVKTNGDSILIVTPENISEESVKELHLVISKCYQIKTVYRCCTFTEREIKIGNYNCTDIFGNDIDQLFMVDEKTGVLN